MIWTVIVTTACVLAAVAAGAALVMWAGRDHGMLPFLPPPLSEFERRLASKRVREAKQGHPAGKARPTVGGYPDRPA